MTPDWQKIADFDLDSPMSAYTFSIRLAKENYWTKNFTRKAIVEYKKFMYLAATSDSMVSPSGVVDVVWHQHLVFTQSYADFCALLGKTIQHVPSTHSKVEFDKFRSARERTRQLYTSQFGQPPEDIWNFAGMYDSLHLEKADFKIRSFILVGLLAFAAVSIPAYFLLRPLYVNLSNPAFFLNYSVVIVISLTALNMYSNHCVDKLVLNIHRTSFLFDLHPMEVVYLKTRLLKNVVAGTLNQLLVDKKIGLTGTQMSLITDVKPATPEEFTVYEELSPGSTTSFNVLEYKLSRKAVFSNVEESMNALGKYFVKSKKFGQMFYVNFGVLSVVFMLGFIRLCTGLLRDKPVVIITIFLIGLAVIILVFLVLLKNKLGTQTVEQVYKRRLKELKATSDSWAWDYAFGGTILLTPAFATVVNASSAGSSSSGSDSGDSGSSCGSSCGGCGGGS